MSELWVARDADGALFEFRSKPVLRGGFWMANEGEYLRRLDSSEHHDLKPGECRRLVMAEETSE